MAVAIGDCIVCVVIAAIQPVRLAACLGVGPRTSKGGRAMNPQRFAVIAASCGTLGLIGWAAAGVVADRRKRGRDPRAR